MLFDIGLIVLLGSGMGALDWILRDDPGLFGINPGTDKPYKAAQIYSFLRYTSYLSLFQQIVSCAQGLLDHTLAFRPHQ